MLRLPRSLIVAVALIACTSCGNSGKASPDAATSATSSATSSTSTSASDSTASGEVSGDGYSFALPDTWQDGTAKFKEMNPIVDSGAFESGPAAADGFAQNVNVIVESFDGPLEDYVKISLAQVKDRKLQRPDDLEVDGQKTAHFLSEIPVEDKKVVSDQYLTVVNGKAYTVTISFQEDTSAAERNAVSSAILDSWRWAA